MASVPEQVPRLLEMAMRAALQRGGVGVVVIPGELFLADAPAGPSPTAVRAAKALVRPDYGALAAAAQVLENADRVTILAGAGCAGAHDELLALAEALKAPVVHAMRGKEFVDVIAVSGDGGLSMLLGELLTLGQRKLPVKILVFNNGALSFVELEMKAAGIVTFGTELLDADFAAVRDR